MARDSKKNDDVVPSLMMICCFVTRVITRASVAYFSHKICNPRWPRVSAWARLLSWRSYALSFRLTSWTTDSTTTTTKYNQKKKKRWKIRILHSDQKVGQTSCFLLRDSWNFITVTRKCLASAVFEFKKMRRGPFKFSFFFKPKPVDFHFSDFGKEERKHKKKWRLTKWHRWTSLQGRQINLNTHIIRLEWGLLVFFLQSIGDNVNVYKTGIRTFGFKLCVSIIYVTYIFFIPHYTHTHWCKNA